MNSNKNNILKKLENLKEDDIDNNNIIKIHKTNYNNNIKCFWCKNLFNNRPVNMPVSYINNKFIVQGHYCSFNCCLSYSIDMRDNKHFYRKSLINYYYFLTYGKFINITPAPNWRCLKAFGGPLTIKDFRNNSIINSKEFILLEPPIKARTSSILELKKQKKSNERYVLKRTKPINKNFKDINNFLS